MTLKLGSEYDLPEAKNKTSTKAARKLFLILISELKPDVVRELIDPFDWDSLPPQWKENPEKIRLCNKIFLAHTQHPATYLIDLTTLGFPSNFRSTLYFLFFDFVHKKHKELNEFVKEGVKRDVWLEPCPLEYKIKVSKRYALNKFLPNWSALKKIRGSEILCDALIKWSEKWNIKYDWVLDAAVNCLKNIKFDCIDKLQIPENYDVIESDLINQYYEKLEQYSPWIKSTFYKRFDSSKSKKKKTIPTFDYKLLVNINNETDVITGYFGTYNPIEETAEEFRKMCEEVFWADFINYYALDSRWRTLIGQTDWFLKELKTFTRSLDEHIKSVESYYETFVVKAPIKKDDSHFRWLIEYQIPKVKSYADIAKANFIDESTVREGVQSVADMVGIELRKGKRTGRPKGVKETRKRGNYKNW